MHERRHHRHEDGVRPGGPGVCRPSAREAAEETPEATVKTGRK